MSIILTAAGTIIDSVFCTIFLYNRKQFKHYWQLVALISTIIFTKNVFGISMNAQIVAYVAVFVASLFFSKLDGVNIAIYTLLPFVFSGILSALLITLIGVDDMLYISMWVIQLFIIFTVFEKGEQQIQEKYLSITLKIVVLILIVMLFGITKYYVEWGR